MFIVQPFARPFTFKDTAAIAAKMQHNNQEKRFGFGAERGIEPSECVPVQQYAQQLESLSLNLHSVGPLVAPETSCQVESEKQKEIRRQSNFSNVGDLARNNLF